MKYYVFHLKVLVTAPNETEARERLDMSLTPRLYQTLGATEHDDPTEAAAHVES